HAAATEFFQNLVTGDGRAFDGDRDWLRWFGRHGLGFTGSGRRHGWQGLRLGSPLGWSRIDGHGANLGKAREEPGRLSHFAATKQRAEAVRAKFICKSCQVAW